MPSINLFDIIALIWFLSCWIIYAGIADRRGLSSSSLTRATHAYRELWMQRMLERDNRIIDSNLVGHLMGSVSFFASTTIIIIGGLIAVLGATEKAIAQPVGLNWKQIERLGTKFKTIQTNFYRQRKLL